MNNGPPSSGNRFPSLSAMTVEMSAPAPTFTLIWACLKVTLLATAKLCCHWTGGNKTKHNKQTKSPPNRLCSEDGANMIDFSRRGTRSLHYVSVGINKNLVWCPREAQCGAKFIHFRRISKRGKNQSCDEMVWCGQSRSQRLLSIQRWLPSPPGTPYSGSLFLLLYYSGDTELSEGTVTFTGVVLQGSGELGKLQRRRNREASPTVWAICCQLVNKKPWSCPANNMRTNG